MYETLFLTKKWHNDPPTTYYSPFISIDTIETLSSGNKLIMKVVHTTTFYSCVKYIQRHRTIL